MERKEAYAKIKELNLQEECKKKYGKNFTQCKTEELVSIINDAAAKKTVKTTNKSTEPVSTPVNTSANIGDIKTLFKRFGELLDILRSRHILMDSEVKKLLS